MAAQHRTGLTLMTTPEQLGIKDIIRLIMKMPKKKNRCCQYDREYFEIYQRSLPKMPPITAGAQCNSMPAIVKAMPSTITTMANIVTCQEVIVGTRMARSMGPAVVTWKSEFIKKKDEFSLESLGYK